MVSNPSMTAPCTNSTTLSGACTGPTLSASDRPYFPNIIDHAREGTLDALRPSNISRPCKGPTKASG